MGEVRSQMKTRISFLILPTETELEGWQDERMESPDTVSKALSKIRTEPLTVTKNHRKNMLAKGIRQPNGLEVAT